MPILDILDRIHSILLLLSYLFLCREPSSSGISWKQNRINNNSILASNLKPPTSIKRQFNIIWHISIFVLALYFWYVRTCIFVSCRGSTGHPNVILLLDSCIGLCNAYVNQQIYLCVSYLSGQRKPEYWLRAVVLIAAPESRVKY